jgi:hypothetical protein
MAPAVERPLVEHAGEGDLVGQDLRVLEMDVVDGRAECSDHGDRVHALPEQVGRVEVDADDRTDRVAHALERRHVVDQVERVELEGQPLDACRFGLAREVPPQRDRGIPLALEQGHRIVRPGVPDEVHRVAARAVARVARHRHELVHTELGGEPDRLADERDVPVAHRRMQRPGRAVEGGDPQAASREGLDER